MPPPRASSVRCASAVLLLNARYGASSDFLIFCAYLDERTPALAKSLKVKTTMLMVGYNAFVLVLPQFPRLQQALTDRQRFEDVRLASSVEGCLSGMQAVISDYRAKLED